MYICICIYVYIYINIYIYVGVSTSEFKNRDSPTGKLFPPLPRYGERFIGNRTRSQITNHDFPSEIEIFFKFFKQFSLKYRSFRVESCLKALRKEN